MLEETCPPGASQRCQICWRGQASCWKVWGVKALLDPAVTSGKGRRRGDARRLGCPHWTWLAGSIDAVRGHMGKRQRGVGLPALVLGDRDVLGGVTAPYLGRWVTGSCRVSGMSLGTCSFSTWKSCPGSTRGFGMLIWAPRGTEANGGAPLQPAAPRIPRASIPGPAASNAGLSRAGTWAHAETGANHHHGSFAKPLGTTIPFPWEKGLPV